LSIGFVILTTSSICKGKRAITPMSVTIWIVKFLICRQREQNLPATADFSQRPELLKKI